jgi:hypothetical protein
MSDEVQQYQDHLLAKRIASRFIKASYAKLGNLTDDDTLSQLVEMEMESMEIDGEPTYESLKAVDRAASTYEDAVEDVLTKWVKANMDKIDMDGRLLKGARRPDDVVEVMMDLRGGAAYLYFMEAEGHGVGTWDGDWDPLFKDHRSTIKELSRHVEQKTKQKWRDLKQAIEDAAFSADDEGEED